MSNENKKGPGGHYSGKNPIPNISRFIQSLDAEKAERDKRIEEEQAQNVDVSDHVEATKEAKKEGKKIVTDPVTGSEVEIEDVDKEFMQKSKEPTVGISLNDGKKHC